MSVRLERIPPGRVSPAAHGAHWGMTSWAGVTAGAPDLAKSVRHRFEAHGLALMASLRRDGSPRLSAVEPLFARGDLWLGMMPGSRKAADVLRDPRLALHGATTDKAVSQGDAKVAGRAVPIYDKRVVAAFVAAFEATTGSPPPPGPFHLFTVDVDEISFLRPAGDHLVIDWWREGGPVRRVERR
jgi:hypothetical protein